MSWAQTLVSKLAGAENTANVTLATLDGRLWVRQAKKNRVRVKTWKFKQFGSNFFLKFLLTIIIIIMCYKKTEGWKADIETY